MDQFVQFVFNHWMLWLALIVILVSIFINEIIANKKRVNELSPAVAVDCINNENAMVIDIRDNDAFRNGHIIQSISASAEDFNLPKLEKYKTQPLILVCTRGVIAAQLATKLRTQGYTHLMVLAGGIEAWKSAGMPVVKGKN